MIGINTNILLRALETYEDPKQTRAVHVLLQARAPVFIGPIVLVEFVWVMESKFQFDRHQIFRKLQRVVSAPEFEFFDRDATDRAIVQFGKGNLEFADCLIGELNLAMGCETTMTFDKNAARIGTFTRLES